MPTQYSNKRNYHQSLTTHTYSQTYRHTKQLKHIYVRGEKHSHTN